MSIWTHEIRANCSKCGAEFLILRRMKKGEKLWKPAKLCPSCRTKNGWWSRYAWKKPKPKPSSG